ncbi:hypothetical protein NQZ68_035035 [Dissostichus eleginoides]|nr:hypothetical protein NQZ68_035035 [Dissostichus eleginoides]
MDPHGAKKRRKGGAEREREKKKKAREEEAAKCAKITDLFRTPRMVQTDEAESGDNSSAGPSQGEPSTSTEELAVPLSDDADGDDPEGEMQAELSARTELAANHPQHTSKKAQSIPQQGWDK